MYIVENCFIAQMYSTIYIHVVHIICCFQVWILYINTAIQLYIKFNDELIVVYVCFYLNATVN